MNPNYYRSASPQPQSAAASQRDHAARAMYQNPYGATHDMQMRSLQLGTPFGFFPGATQFTQGTPANYHLVAAEMNRDLQQQQQQLLQQQQQQQRSVSPPRRRPEFHGERERYLRAGSPTENNRSPSGPSSQQRHSQQRPPSPQQQQQRSNHHPGRYEPRESSTSSSHDRHPSLSQGGGMLKKPRLNETSHYDDHYPPRGGNSSGVVQLKPENRQQEYVSRPMPLEAISPPAEENNEVDRMLMQVQDEIRTLDKNMNDCEMALHQWEAELKAAETRKEEYDKAQRSHAELAKPDSPAADVTGDVARRVISENRRISEAEHRAAAKKLQLIVPIPAVVSNPMDLTDVMQVLRDYHKQRPGIILRLKKDRQAKQIRERYLKERYKQLSQAYVSRLEKIENNPKKKVREAKMREYYERQFPEIKKIREDKIRDGRSGSRKGDETDGSSSVNGTDESELEKYHRNAVLVPMLLDAKDRSRHFYDRNRLVENCANEYKLSITNCFWTQEEKDIFKEKYLQRPKDFGYICSFLKRKTVEDCVQHYYLTKRKEMYKQMIKKQKAYRIRRGPNKRLQSAEDPLSPSKLVSPSMPLTSPSVGPAMRLFVSESRGDNEDVRAIALTIVCPAKKCHARRRVVKRLFKAPYDLLNFTEICRQLELPETAVSCCKYCVSYLEKRLGLKKWSSTEVEALKKGLISHGANWNLISKLIPAKRLRDCMQYYRRHSTELTGSLAGDVPPLSLPPLADDEYSPFSASSSSDEETPVNGQNHEPDEPAKLSETIVRVRTVSEDSNATLSADEDEPEPPIPRFMTTLPRPAGTPSFTPNQLPVCETSRSRMASPYAMSPDPRVGSNGPACVRDLIHSAIEKNLDKHPQAMPAHHVPEEFRRRLESTISNIGRQQDRPNQYQDRRGDIDVAAVSRSVDEGNRGMGLLSPRGMPSRDHKSPNRPDVMSASASPGRRDLSPLNPDDRNRLSTIRSPSNQQPPPQAYQYSTRQNLMTDFATSRQIHAEQHAGDPRPFEGQPGMQQPDPRFMQFYSPYVYLPQGYGQMPMQISAEYMESLAAASFAAQMTSAGGSGQPIRGPVPGPQRSIILGTGRPGLSDEQLPPGGGGGGGDSANRLQTLTANRGILRGDIGSNPGGGGDKRTKPDVITIDDARRDNQSSPALHPDMRFHPAAHHLLKPKTEALDQNPKEPNPNLTAGSLIDVIITRQISNPGQNAGRGSPTTPTPQQQSRPTVIPKREMPSSDSAHKPFTLGEHIEQIIASDFSRKDTLGGPSGHMPPGMMSMVGGPGVGGYQQFAARMEDANWKRNRLRMDEPVTGPPTGGSSYLKPSTSSVTSSMQYEPISPANSRDNSESGGDEEDDDRDMRNDVGGDK